jgi:hypothetical protein
MLISNYLHGCARQRKMKRRLSLLGPRIYLRAWGAPVKVDYTIDASGKIHVWKIDRGEP